MDCFLPCWQRLVRNSAFFEHDYIMFLFCVMVSLNKDSMQGWFIVSYGCGSFSQVGLFNHDSVLVFWLSDCLWICWDSYVSRFKVCFLRIVIDLIYISFYLFDIEIFMCFIREVIDLRIDQCWWLFYSPFWKVNTHTQLSFTISFCYVDLLDKCMLCKCDWFLILF